MRKIVSALLFTFAFSSASHAQNIKLGINAGATYSNFSGIENPNDNFEPEVNFLVGFSAEYLFSEHLALKANLSYDRKSSHGESIETFLIHPFPLEDEILFSKRTIGVRYEYLTLPVMAKWNFGKSKRFFVNGGPFVGYLLNAESHSTNDQASTLKIYSDGTLNITDFTKRIDYGVSVGIGKSFRLTDKNDLVVEIRDNLGLSNTNDFPGGNDIKINSVNLILGWQFTL